MDIREKQLVVTTQEVLIPKPIGYYHVPPYTTGVVLKVEGGSIFKRTAFVRFNVDGEPVEGWVNADELLPR